MLRAIQAHGPSKPIHFYCSSGGNAGLACANAAISLKRPATIVVPMSTLPLMVSKLKTLGADVHQYGASWMEADSYLREEFLNKDPNGVYVPPFDHPDIWEGAATLIDEIDEQIGEYDGVVCSVGGGGLFCGIMEGLARRKEPWGHSAGVKILTVETRGADSLARSMTQGEHIMLPEISSIATSLGAKRVARRAFELARRKEVSILTLSDAEAAMGCVRFADDERFLIEVSCGVSIASVYNGQLREKLGKGMSDVEWSEQKIVIIVCGGNIVTLEMLQGYKEKYGKMVKMCGQVDAMRRAENGVQEVGHKFVSNGKLHGSENKNETGYSMPVYTKN
jgi:L-serine/L-threonine ammonia-lyase